MMAANLTLNIQEIGIEKLPQILLDKIIQAYSSKYSREVFFAFEFDHKFYLAEENSLGAGSGVPHSDIESKNATGDAEHKGIEIPLVSQEEFFKSQKLILAEVNKMAKLMPPELGLELKRAFQKLNKDLEEDTSPSTRPESADLDPKALPLPDLWRAPPPEFKGEAGLLTLGELGVVKKLMKIFSKPDDLLVREVLGGQAYQILGVKFADSFLYGPPGDLSIEKEFVGGERFSATGESLISSPFDSVPPQELAVLTLAAAALGDPDFCGFSVLYAAGHNLRVEDSHVFGFDPGEAFDLEGKNFALDFFDDLQKDLPLFGLLDWLNKLIFKDTGNSFLQAGETCPSELVELREAYQAKGIVELTQKNLTDILANYEKLDKDGFGQANKSLLWRFLTSGIFSGERPLPKFFKGFISNLDPYLEEAEYEGVKNQFGSAMRKFIYDAVRFRALKSLLSKVTVEDWKSARTQVLARVEQVLQFLKEADLPEALLPQGLREDYQAQVRLNKREIEALSFLPRAVTLSQKPLQVIDLAVASTPQGSLPARAPSLMLGSPPLSVAAASSSIQGEEISPVLGRRLYYPSQFEMPTLAVAGRGATGVAFKNLKQPLPVLAFQGVFQRSYNLEKGLGRKLFKASYSREMTELKDFMDSPEERRHASWVDVEREIITIFSEALGRGENPFDWKKLSNRTLWLFLMEAHYQQEQKISQQRKAQKTRIQEKSGEREPSEEHARFNLGSLEEEIWTAIYPENHDLLAPHVEGRASILPSPQSHQSRQFPELPKRIITGEPPSLSPSSRAHHALGDLVPLKAIQNVAKVARFFPKVRAQAPGGFDGFLKILSSDISIWKKGHIKWYHFGRRIFGIRGIRQILKELRHRELTPTEILSQINSILAKRLAEGTHQDTKNFYQKLQRKIASRVGNLEQDAESKPESKADEKAGRRPGPGILEKPANLECSPAF
jgi:hypothetical protein